MTDHNSYLSRHRPICTVINDIYEKALRLGDKELQDLCLEAKDYAQRMSNRLMEYKRKEMENADRK